MIIRRYFYCSILAILLIISSAVKEKKSKENSQIKDELYQAVYIADVERVNYLLSLDPKIISSRPPTLVNRRNEPFSQTSAMVCGIDPQKASDLVDKDCSKIIRKLHEAGANLSIVDSTGWDALSLAAFRGLTRACRYIVKSKTVDINRQDNDGKTALMKAAGNGYKDTFNMLAKNGAALLLRDSFGRNALHHATLFAIKNSSIEYLQHYIEYYDEYDLNTLVDNDGRNILMYLVISNDHFLVSSILQQFHFDIEIKDNFGVTVKKMTQNSAVLKVVADYEARLIEHAHEMWLKTRFLDEEI
jgi:ankyrin repeat protein